MARRTFLLWLAMATAIHGQTFTSLHNFGGIDGAYPGAVLIQGVDGNLYGTTQGGGIRGDGTVFKMTPSGTLTTIYSFCSEANCADGSSPYAGLVLGTDGNFYGTTEQGGFEAGGTVFKITQGGKLTTLYTFCVQSGCPDGTHPEAGLVQGIDGNFYGTTFEGGANVGNGTVFKITPGGALTTLYIFCPNSRFCTNGRNPTAGLVQGTDGRFYGTTPGGGGGPYGPEGTVFKITAGGLLTTVHKFDLTDGSGPYAGLIQGLDGNFYGTTYGGSGLSGKGTVFEMTPSGTLTTLHSFLGPDGSSPEAGLVQGTDGDFYGTTLIGGTNDNGTIFEITGSGTLTTLYTFCPNLCAEGDEPVAGLVQHTTGPFYGTTSIGGDLNCGYGGHGCGTLFNLNTGLGPFVAFVHNPAKFRQQFGILGQSFTGTTAVLLNGTAASFVVKSDTFILATVPAGATTGYVTVTTPSGTLASNVPFVVIP